MIDPTFDIESVFVFPTGKKARKRMLVSKIHICNVIQMSNIERISDPDLMLSHEQIQELIICERIHLN